MSGLVDALVILAVVVLVIARQFRTRRITTDRSWWVVPAVLVFLALREPGLLDPDHRTLSVLLLGTELLIGLATGVGWAWTTRMWRTPDGTVWSRSSKASALVWTAGIALRAGLFGLGAALGLRQDSSALLLALAVTLLVRSGIMVRRAQTLPPASGRSAAYGDGMPQPSRKERV
ncbi:CcdC protein domain-containing protein [Streptomyces liliifuscus]|uniref:DUF1453 family protein n=1 Tax=Streptomyces liliifuscus TaxID=2797636 RepID=A0A7T7KVM2_9ACTN|nr:CcdC protein domain-containing protein [Streptomyces liliifuscus]QQM40367.1 DUF1453 family protein [Streptomyces liliifuscus]